MKRGKRRKCSKILIAFIHANFLFWFVFYILMTLSAITVSEKSDSYPLTVGILMRHVISYVLPYHTSMNR